jgi:phosphatidylserine/phosphatidylglycerophosphate/cardiolipin synthase-like enzyme
MTEHLIYRGLKVYEVHNKFLHMKLYIFDDESYILGSFNNDRISWNINNELNLAVDEKL